MKASKSVGKSKIQVLRLCFCCTPIDTIATPKYRSIVISRCDVTTKTVYTAVPSKNAVYDTRLKSRKTRLKSGAFFSPQNKRVWRCIIDLQMLATLCCHAFPSPSSNLRRNTRDKAKNRFRTKGFVNKIVAFSSLRCPFQFSGFRFLLNICRMPHLCLVWVLFRSM